MSGAWDAYLPFRDRFSATLDPRRHTIAWLDGLVLSGGAQVWATTTAAVLTELRHYPTGARDVHALIAAGNLDEIVTVLTPEIERWAQAMGCIGAVVESREGWAKALKPLGYVTHQLALRKDF